MRKLIQGFVFKGNSIQVSNNNSPDFSSRLTPTVFNYEGSTSSARTIHSLQTRNEESPPYLKSAPYYEMAPWETPKIVPVKDVRYEFKNITITQLLATLSGGVDGIFAFYSNYYYAPIPPSQVGKPDIYGLYYTSEGEKSYNELKEPSAVYNWEVGFHAPMQLVERLLDCQQFDRALEVIHYVFNPHANPNPAMPTEDITHLCWQFPPFKDVTCKQVLERIFDDLKPLAPNSKINDWREHPFEPHVLARNRPSAYMKYVVMTYIEILIAYGDYYFRQNSMESIPLATQCYVMASHLLGPHGQKIPQQGVLKKETYNSLLDQWDAFGNAMVEMEVAFPFSSQSSKAASSGIIGSAGIFGSMQTLYFCIPNNPKLTELRNTIDDRLLKIRSCENIEGIFQQLPLFEPPIDPALLVQAAAQGISLTSVLNDMNSPMPNYRFYYLLQKALELCCEVKSLGSAFLSAKEKGDAEALSNLRAKHETAIQNLALEVKKHQVTEATRSVDALQQSRKNPESRMKYYLTLINEDLGKVPDSSTDFTEVPNQLEQPVDESGLKLIKYEKEEIDKSCLAQDWQTASGVVETLASILHIIPNFSTDGKPWGIGAGVVWGGAFLGNAAQAVAQGLRVHSGDLSFQSSHAGRKAGFLRQLQDRVQQANAAGYEIKNIDKQILTQQIRIDIANQEIINQQKQIDHASEVEDFLRNKYSNIELYSWMERNIRTLFYQAYTLAYDLAKKAEKSYRFERGLTESNFIQFGYWDGGRDGLLAGERLYLALKQLEAAYQEKRGYDFEVTKHVSLRQIDPLALLRFRDEGKCQFALPEVLFDMDHPGHYMRRIKSVALSIPCVVGPHTSLNCTLRLLEHKFRYKPFAKDRSDYLERTEEPDDRFSTVNVPITSIAASSGQNDSGVFELNFKDERYIPFEGAGAISKWRLELPPVEIRQFDYDTITDVILHIRYTSVDGGDKLKEPASEVVHNYMNAINKVSNDEGLFALFDIRCDFATEWQKALTANQEMDLAKLPERLPFFAGNGKAKATDTYLVISPKPSAGETVDQALARITGKPTLNAGTAGETPSSALVPAIERVVAFVWHGLDSDMKGWKLTIPEGAKENDKAFLVVRYSLSQ